ncbi:helix-turn-helix domain-containing protein [Cerasicoccus fimbriatus]|uniref:helix-turn-helix domain-containing protein n=1 Tax=Cerasicoccus fimbriatus TaxID=3014554 RepID=UPI0022B4913D|nr:AraC family transcriptional regulator [Cerasicoccus sp. TK19100]
MDFCDRRHSTPRHHQRGIEINITNECRGKLTIGEREIQLSPRLVVIFSGSYIHELKANPGEDYMRTVMCLDPAHAPTFQKTELVQKIIEGEIHIIRLDSSEYIEAIQQLRRLNIELIGRPMGWEAMSSALAWSIALRLMRIPAITAKPILENRSTTLVREAIAHIQTHLDTPLTLRETAEQFEVSAEHLTRSFTRQTGLSFHRFVLSERISVAQNLLSSRPNISLIDIALMTGFSSASNFSRAFRAAKGMAPSEYRKSTLFS